MRRPQNFAKSSPYLCLMQCHSKDFENFAAFSEYMNLKKNLVKSQVYKQIFKCDMTIVLTPLRIARTPHVYVCEFNVKSTQKSWSGSIQVFIFYMKDNYKLKRPQPALFFSDSIRFQFRKKWEEQIFCQIGECATQKQKHPLLKYLNQVMAIPTQNI